MDISQVQFGPVPFRGIVVSFALARTWREHVGFISSSVKTHNAFLPLSPAWEARVIK